MALTVLITLTTAGADTGPFNLYSNMDGFLVPFETSISKIDLELGYVSFLVPDGTTTIRVLSMSTLCSNYVDLPLDISTTTTTTTTSFSTTSTTTTAAPAMLFWNVSGEIPSGNLKIYINTILIIDADTDDFINSGSFNIEDGFDVQVVGTWQSGSGNEVKFRVCSETIGELNFTDKIGIDVGFSTPKSYSFTYESVDSNISVFLRDQGNILPTCGV